MPTRTIVQVFLGSPGDLQDERRAAKAVFDKFNKQWAEHFGIGVELVGWEDTVSQYGRPQETINRDLERCELFIGLMHKKWGTPPSHGGEFTSGFEEEFELSLRSRRKSKRPEISLYFKSIDEEFLKDKGPDLQKVLTFRDRITAEKEILYETFSSLREFEERIESCVVRYVQKLAKESEEHVAEESKKKPSKDEQSAETTNSTSTPLTPEGAHFLREFVSKSENDDAELPLSAAEIARFRLLSTIVNSNGNDEVALKTHDANLLYAQRNAVQLSRREMQGLIRAALDNAPHETIPLWHWYVAANAQENGYLSLMSFIGSQGERAGALAAMTLIHEEIKPLDPIGPGDEGFQAHDFIRSWLSEGTQDNVKTAALEYLSVCGKVADLPFILEEFKKGSYQTKGPAIDAIVSINLRQSREAALKVLFELEPESVDQRIVDAVFGKPETLSTELLLLGASHRSTSVRRAVVMILQSRSALGVKTTERLLEDSDVEIRFAGLTVLTSSGREYSEEQAKSIIVKPRARSGLGGLFSPFAPSIDPADVIVWERFKWNKYRAMTEEALTKLVPTETFIEPNARFALDFKNFKKRKSDLRADVDDQFKAWFTKGINGAEQRLVKADLLTRMRDIEEISRKALTRRGADILAEKSEPEDLARIRKILTDSFVEFSILDVSYLERHGEWQDIPLLAGLSERRNYASSLLGSYVDDDKQQAIAKAIHHIGKDRLSELCALELPTKLLQQILALTSPKEFKSLSDGELLRLFNSESDNIRKQAALGAIRALPKGRLRKLMKAYTERDGSRFYNVIYWLDLGIVLSRTRILHARSIIQRRQR